MSGLSLQFQFYHTLVLKLWKCVYWLNTLYYSSLILQSGQAKVAAWVLGFFRVHVFTILLLIISIFNVIMM